MKCFINSLFTLNSADLVSGVYFIYMHNGKFTDSRKVVILK